MRVIGRSAFFLLTLSGCASLGSDREKNAIHVTELSSDDVKTVAATEESALADYTFNAAPHKAEWLDCKAKKGAAPQATLLLMHRDRAGWQAGHFCEGWIAQAFLSQGFNVVAVNRPGYGQSTGTPDFSGAQSLAAVDAALKDAAAKSKNAKPVNGIWGYSTGATAAAIYAKHAGSFKFAILGGGIYDFDEALRTTKDDYLKQDLEQIKKTGGAKALEDRSLGYDVGGLPKVIALYHGKDDQTVLLAQAQAFSDSLASNGAYTVTFQALDGVPHDIPWKQHWRILEVLARPALTSAGN